MLTLNVAKIPIHGRQREGFESRLVAVKAKELQEVPHSPLIRLAAAERRSPILEQMLQESSHLLLGTRKRDGAARLEAPVCL